MSDQPRIQQFKTMAEADPNNELGHFSLGKAYLDAGRFDEAIAPLTRVLELNPRMSKAYQLLGEAYDKTDQRDEAIDMLKRGAAMAHQQGDLMTRDAMTKQLATWNVTVPLFSTPPGGATVEDGGTASTTGFRCSRCGRPNGQLQKAPFKGALGEKLLANICTSCWKEWIPMGTKVINELGLVLSTPADSQAYDQSMVEFLQLEDR